ncbi:hypothetical protein RBSWK_00700 [Rhodopirellula baltica SWK14]|uniref:Uncharacterized protein n=1 Tax=Rhodopirellula baltica SWK14 TaxID=993516 RepID=L7CN04_RHOBT|nr:hypothetical protein RBSWK_00700 [Rhodopirellula baltica SWK14]
MKRFLGIVHASQDSALAAIESAQKQIKPPPQLFPSAHRMIVSNHSTRRSC